MLGRRSRAVKIFFFFFKGKRIFGDLGSPFGELGLEAGQEVGLLFLLWRLGGGIVRANPLAFAVATSAEFNRLIEPIDFIESGGKLTRLLEGS